MVRRIRTQGTLTNSQTGQSFPVTVHVRPESLVGKRIRLLEMPLDPAPLAPGSEGTVERVSNFDDAGGWCQIHVKWDSGRTLMLCVPPDRFEVVQQE